LAKQESAAAKVRIPPEALLAMQLDEMNSRLADIFGHMVATTPEGVDFPIEEQTVTSITRLNFERDFPYRPIRSIDFFNKGSSTVYIRADDAKEIYIEDREQIAISRPKATIKHVTLRVASGSARIRMVGHY